MLDVVIGLVFVWFLLSLAVSAVNETFAWLTRVRAKQLWQAVARVVDDKVAPAPLRWGEDDEALVVREVEQLADAIDRRRDGRRCQTGQPRHVGEVFTHRQVVVEVRMFRKEPDAAPDGDVGRRDR